LLPGGRYTGFGLLGYTAYRLFVFLCRFVAERQDAREARLNAQEQRLEASLGNRLAHLERAENSNLDRIRLLEARVALAEGWVATLATELRMKDPGNPKLAELAKMLTAVTPIAPRDPLLDEILKHAANAPDKEPKP
jgi:hypothetical protein